MSISRDFQVRHGLIVNTSLFVANTQTGRVGVGIDNPTSNLHVIGSGNITSGLTVSGINIAATLVSAFNATNNIVLDTKTIGYTIDGGGGPIELGLAGIGVQVSFNGRIQSVTSLADRTGNCTIDIWRGPYAAYPLSNANTITANSRVTLNNASKNVDSTLTGWANTISSGDILQFNVLSNDNIERLTLMITAQRTY